MLAVSTRDNWAFSVTVTVAAIPAETYTNSATNNNAQLASQAFLTWLQSAARGWWPAVTWALSSARSATSGTRYTYTCGNIFTLSGGAATCLGLAAGGYAGAATSSSDAAGTWWPDVQPAVRDYARFAAEGNAASAGAVRPDSPGAGLYQVKIEAIGTAVDAARLSAVLGQSSTPRTASIYQLHKDRWLLLSLGDLQRSRNLTDYRFAFEAVGA